VGVGYPALFPASVAVPRKLGACGRARAAACCGTRTQPQPGLQPQPSGRLIHARAEPEPAVLQQFAELLLDIVLSCRGDLPPQVRRACISEVAISVV